MKSSSKDQPWQISLAEPQFQFLQRLLGAPSPIGFEAAMTEGVLRPYFEEHKLAGWSLQQFRGNAGLVIDTAPTAATALSVMVIGHADKIRMQVRSIGDDGKIWVDSDSFLPSTLVGHEVLLFSEDPTQSGRYRVIEGGTIEAIGAIHFADAELRAGKKGITSEMLFLELQVHGSDRKQQIERLGIKAGDPLILNRKIRRGFSADTFYGAYLDNGLGCFVVAEVARILAEQGGLKNVRYLGAIATHEEIGRMGSRVIAQEYRPDIVIGVDVSHDFEAAPGVKDKRYTPVAMGAGFTLAVGAITHAHLNSLVQEVARERGIPFQHKVVGRDTGTDAMAAVFASIDSAATSIGFPIRNMHTISECGHTGDLLAATHAIVALLQHLDRMNGGAGCKAADLRTNHPRLDRATRMAP
ncbi:MAG: M20/M25/M40 family metallo-hydrolase [Planctomycetota bacterium]